MSQLDQLKSMTTVVVDSGDFATFKEFEPCEATTNPSLLLAALQKDEYKHFIDDALAYARDHCESKSEQLTLAMDRLIVSIGAEILKIVPGRVSTELDAHLSYDTEACIAKAKQLVKLYQELGVDTSKRVLFKIASTWEGIRAAEQLEKEGIHCNMTLLFSFAQAVCCADAQVTLVSPFVGRILDFWKKEKGVDSFAPAEDPGVVSVTRIYNYYKKHGFKTIVMGASFRNKEEILELAGCDLLTISPALMKELQSSNDPVPRKLDPEKAKSMDIPRVSYDEKKFRWEHAADPCGNAKLSEGIVKFAQDTDKLQAILEEKLGMSGEKEKAAA